MSNTVRKLFLRSNVIALIIYTVITSIARISSINEAASLLVATNNMNVLIQNIFTNKTGMIILVIWLLINMLLGINMIINQYTRRNKKRWAI